VNEWQVEMLEDGSVIVTWPSGHSEGPFSSEEYAELEARAHEAT
jgi:hypothetical protein